MAVEVVRGFVLRAVPVGDSDRILDILTRERGLITASARGARRTRSRMLAGTQEFALSDFTLFSNRSRLIVNEVELVESFIGLQSDLTKLVCAAHLSELFLDCLRHEPEQPLLYPFWAYTVNALINGQIEPLLVTHVCGFRLMQIMGYEPLLESCSVCGSSEEPLWFSYSECGVVCRRHLTGASTGSAVKLNDGLLPLLRYVMSAPIERLYSFTVPESTAKVYMELSRRFVQDRMEKAYTRLDLLDVSMRLPEAKNSET